MNIALSLLSAAATAEAAVSDVTSAVASSTESQGVIDRIQAYAATESQTIAQQQLADPDYWSSVGIITLTGILVVFSILGILIFLFWLIGVIFKSIDNNKKNKNGSGDKKNTVAETAKTSAPIAAATFNENVDDAEVIAVISAAIAAYGQQDGTSYKIRSIKRKENRTRSAWSLAGIGDNTRPF